MNKKPIITLMRPNAGARLCWVVITSNRVIWCHEGQEQAKRKLKEILS